MLQTKKVSSNAKKQSTHTQKKSKTKKTKTKNKTKNSKIKQNSKLGAHYMRDTVQLLAHLGLKIFFLYLTKKCTQSINELRAD